MKQNSVSKPLSFTVLEVNDEPMISGGLVSDASRFEDDDELMELAMQSCDDPVFHVNYTGYVWISQMETLCIRPAMSLG